MNRCRRPDVDRGTDATRRVIPIGFYWTGEHVEEYLASARKTMDAEAAAQFERRCATSVGRSVARRTQ